MKYTLCINNGYVIDPQTKTARVAHVGVENGKIAVISDEALEGETVIDAGGHVVCPGFIDVHGHVDGITTYTDHRRCI